MQHDIVLDYITTQAYASTALALSRPKRSNLTTSSGPSISIDRISHTNGLSTNGSGGHQDGMDVDVDMDGVGMASSTDHALDGMGDEIMEGSVSAKAGAAGGGKGKMKERLLSEEALQTIERRRSKSFFAITLCPMETVLPDYPSDLFVPCFHLSYTMVKLMVSSDPQLHPERSDPPSCRVSKHPLPIRSR